MIDREFQQAERSHLRCRAQPYRSMRQIRDEVIELRRRRHIGIEAQAGFSTRSISLRQVMISYAPGLDSSFGWQPQPRRLLPQAGAVHGKRDLVAQLVEHHVFLSCSRRRSLSGRGRQIRGDKS